MVVNIYWLLNFSTVRMVVWWSGLVLISSSESVADSWAFRVRH